MRLSDKVIALQKERDQKKDRLQFYISRLNQLDAGIKAREKIFNHFKGLYNDQAKRFQKLKDQLEPEVAKLENELISYTETKETIFICPYCLKEYKQKHYYDKHIVKCKTDQAEVIEKQSELERLQKELEEKKKQLEDKNKQLQKVDAKVEEIDDIIDGD